MKNTPDLWLKAFPIPSKDGHKYHRGAAVIYGAPKLTGATRLAASACARLCGLTTVIAPEGAGDIYRAALPAHIMTSDLNENEPYTHAFDKRISVVLTGSGGGYDDMFFRNLILSLQHETHLNGIVLDAEGFKAWRGHINHFREQVKIPAILTPHEGEFDFVFKDVPDVFSENRKEKAQNAARTLNVVMVLKGAETVISDNTRLVINEGAPPTLATAGSGDVLAGMITGLVAAGMPAFEASCAGVWIHARAAEKIGFGLVAGDLSDQIPSVLKDLLGIL